MRSGVIRLLVAVLVVLGVGAVASGRLFPGGVTEKIASLGVWAPIVYVAAYAVLAAAFFPASILTLAAGAAFGLGTGVVVCSAGSTLGAALSFLIGRYLARGWIEARMEGSRRFSAIDRAVAGEGWRVVVLTRLSPVFPYGLLNYGFGITGVRFWPYVFSSWLAMIPGTILYVYVGTFGRSLVEVKARERGSWEWMLYGAGLLATVAVILLVTRAARRAMGKIFREEGREDAADDADPDAAAADEQEEELTAAWRKGQGKSSGLAG